MPCYKPLTAYYSRFINKSVKRSLVFSIDKALIPEPVQVPCGQCIGCRLDRSLSWALRCVHEASLYDQNCFITLTFNETHATKSLYDQDFKKFILRLNYALDTKIQYVAVPEFQTRGALHFHLIFFNLRFIPARSFEQIWGHGFTNIQVCKKIAAASSYLLKYLTKENFAPEKITAIKERMKGRSRDELPDIIREALA